MRAFLGVVLWVCALLAQAEVYKWVDANGQTHFSDQPPADETPAETLKLDTINSIPGVEVSEWPAATADSAASTQRVVMYSTQWCGYCKKAAAFFRANGIPFTEYDVETSARGQKDYAALGGGGVPIILVGSKRMRGFSPAQFMQLYQR